VISYRSWSYRRWHGVAATWEIHVTERKGERWGWAGAWVGSFLWVAIVGLVFLAQGNLAPAASGLVICAVALGVAHAMAPWRHPHTPYWRLYLPLYALLAVTVLWACWGFGAFDAGAEQTLDAWMLLWLLPALAPLVTPMLILGRPTWAGGAPEHR